VNAVEQRDEADGAHTRTSAQGVAQQSVAADERRVIGARSARAIINAPLAADPGVKTALADL
jgi:hypothetical protein